MNWCFSGGAKGADIAWGNLAKQLGHKVTHWSFAGHKTNANVTILDQVLLAEATFYVKRANKSLGRTFPTRFENTNNLLKRNYYQVSKTQTVYAACPFKNADDLFASEPEGGTAWAIQMFIDRFFDSKPQPQQVSSLNIFVLNTATNEWFRHDSSYPCSSAKNRIVSIYEKMDELPPEPSGIWTGIGTRELTNENEKVIMSLNRTC